MTVVQWAYLIFAIVGMACFWRFKPRTAVLICLFGGWAFLPVGQFPPFWPGQEGTDFPYWIIGLGLPSDMLFTKAWVCPLVAVLGVFIFDFKHIRTFRPAWADLLPVLWCLSTLGPAIAGRTSDPSPWLSILYLSASWGLTWFLGRLYFSDRSSLKPLAVAIVVSVVAYLPIGVIEGIWGPRVYGWVYEVHPFRFDGDVRYIGFRPLGFMENGNQLGMWLAGGALVALFLALSGVTDRAVRGIRWGWILAIVTAVMLVASQAVGAILLAMGAGVTLFGFQWVRPRTVVMIALTGAVLGFGIYATGVVPLRKLAESNPIGQGVRQALRDAGRGSLGWRLAQDERHLRTAHQTAMVGSGKWDWWRVNQQRPWGQWLMVVGQFGFVGFAAFTAVWLYPAIRALWNLGIGEASAGPGALQAVLAMLLLITWADSLLNSFVLLPLLLVAGGLAVGSSTLPIPASRGGDLPQRQVLGGRAGVGRIG